jgi:hypothetical protein
MSSFILQSNGPAISGNIWSRRWRDVAGLPFALYREWEVRRQMASVQMLDGSFLRDVGVGSGELESVVRHGRESRG